MGSFGDNWQDDVLNYDKIVCERDKKVMVKYPRLYKGRVIFVHSIRSFDANMDLGFGVFSRCKLLLDGISNSLEGIEQSKKAKECLMDILLCRDVYFRVLNSNKEGSVWFVKVYIDASTQLENCYADFYGNTMVDLSLYIKEMESVGFSNFKVDLVDNR